jgi:DNA-binding NarL/FixJ family response regulator
MAVPAAGLSIHVNCRDKRFSCRIAPSPFVYSMEGDMVLQITPAERAVLQLLADGNVALDVADRLRLTEPVLDAMLTGLFERMGVDTPVEAVDDAQRRGLVSISGRQLHLQSI